MSATTKRILVLLSTGSQGSGVVRALAAANDRSTHAQWTILAVTRDANSSKAKKLGALRGVKLIEGSPNDPDTLFDEEKTGGPVHGVFSVQQSFDNPEGGVQGEEKQGKALADSAVKFGVKHFVYTSVNFGGLPGNKTDIPHFESKRKIEEYIKSTHPSLPLTVLGPAAFMENFRDLDPFMNRVVATMFPASLTKPVKLIACADIGVFAALAFQDPRKYTGRTIELAGDDLVGQQILEQYQEVMGKPMPQTYHFVANLARIFIKEFRTMLAFANTTGSRADIAVLRKEHPGLKTWKMWLETEAVENV